MFLGITARLRRQENGSALLIVIGVMAVALILTTLMMSMVVRGLSFTSSTRAGVQSQAAAEAGIAAARAGLNVVGNCQGQATPGTYTSAATPVYTAKVQYDQGSGWTAGCPTSTTTQIRIESTGTAAARGAAGQSAKDTSTVEGIFRWVVPSVVPSGTGMYFYGGALIEANSVLDLSESTGAGVIVKQGNLVCDKNNGVINGSVLVNGDLTLSQKCSINGSAWVTGAATLGNGSVADNLNAASVSPNPPGSQVGGAYNDPSVTIPAAPDWAEVGYVPGNWLDADGNPFEVRAVTGAGCTLPNGNLGGTITGKPVIIDARGCVGGPTALNNTTVKLTSDVVLFAEQFNWDEINSLVFQSATSATRRIWFITPDYTADNAPTCQTGSPHLQSDFAIKNGFKIDSTVEAFLYTPCAFQGMNGFTWRGQIYAGAYSNVKNNPSFAFTPVGIAGMDLDTGHTVPVITHPQPGAVLSIRDLATHG